MSEFLNNDIDTDSLTESEVRRLWREHLIDSGTRESAYQFIRQRSDVTTHRADRVQAAMRCVELLRQRPEHQDAVKAPPVKPGRAEATSLTTDGMIMLRALVHVELNRLRAQLAGVEEICGTYYPHAPQLATSRKRVEEAEALYGSLEDLHKLFDQRSDAIRAENEAREEVRLLRAALQAERATGLASKDKL
jgi:hypothetical protein